MKKIFIRIFVVSLLMYLSNLITHNFTIDIQKKKSTERINDCFVNRNSLDSLDVNIFSEKNGFITEITNKDDCFILKEIDIKIEFLNGDVLDTLNLKIRDDILPFQTGSIYVPDVNNEKIKVLKYKVLKVK